MKFNLPKKGGKNLLLLDLVLYASNFPWVFSTPHGQLVKSNKWLSINLPFVGSIQLVEAQASTGLETVPQATAQGGVIHQSPSKVGKTDSSISYQSPWGKPNWMVIRTAHPTFLLYVLSVWCTIFTIIIFHRGHWGSEWLDPLLHGEGAESEPGLPATMDSFPAGWCCHPSPQQRSHTQTQYTKGKKNRFAKRGRPKHQGHAGSEFIGNMY